MKAKPILSHTARSSVLMGAAGILSFSLVTAAYAGVVTPLPDATIDEYVFGPGSNPVTTSDAVSARTGSGTTSSFTGGAEPFVPNTGSSVLYLFSSAITNSTSLLSTTGTISVGGGGNSASVTPAGTADPSLSTSVVLLPDNIGAVLTQDVLTYDFEVVSSNGSTGTANITVNATGAASVQSGASTDQSLRAKAMLYSPGFPLDDEVDLNFGVTGTISDPSMTAGTGFISSGGFIGASGTSKTGGFNEAGTYAVNLGQVYAIELITLVDCSSPGGTSCSASVDPIITDDSPDSSLLFSPGFGDSAGATAVPEPPTWALLLSGLVAAGLMKYRRAGNNRLRGA